MCERVKTVSVILSRWLPTYNVAGTESWLLHVIVSPIIPSYQRKRNETFNLVDRALSTNRNKTYRSLE